MRVNFDDLEIKVTAEVLEKVGEQVLCKKVASKIMERGHPKGFTNMLLDFKLSLERKCYKVRVVVVNGSCQHEFDAYLVPRSVDLTIANFLSSALTANKKPVVVGSWTTEVYQDTSDGCFLNQILVIARNNKVLCTNSLPDAIRSEVFSHNSAAVVA